MNIPPLHMYWDRLPPRPMGDASPTTIFTAVGHALTQWEWAEENLCSLLRIFSGVDSPAVTRVYGTIASASGRLEAMENAAEVFFDLNPSLAKDHYPNWKLLKRHFAEATGRRNDIAHGKAISITLNGKHYGNYLCSAYYMSRKTSPDTSFFRPEKRAELAADPFATFFSDYRFVSDDIESYAGKFRELNNWMCDFFSDLYEEHRHSGH